MKNRLTDELTDENQAKAWVQDWHLYQEMYSPIPEEPEGDGVPVLPPEKIPEIPAQPIAVGQIRRLSDSVSDWKLGDVFVAVISEWDNGWYLIAPFSQLAFPADRGELMLPEPICVSGGRLSVLQPWCTLSCPPEFLRDSHVYGELPQKQIIEDSFEIFRATLMCREPDEALNPRLGPSAKVLRRMGESFQQDRMEFYAHSVKRVAILRDKIFDLMEA